MLINEIIAASDEVAAALGVTAGAAVLHLRRLRLALGEPLALMENYLPEEQIEIGQMDLAGKGLYQLLRSRGVTLRVAKQRIHARTGSPRECAVLWEETQQPDADRAARRS